MAFDVRGRTKVMSLPPTVIVAELRNTEHGVIIMGASRARVMSGRSATRPQPCSNLHRLRSSPGRLICLRSSAPCRHPDAHYHLLNVGRTLFLQELESASTVLTLADRMELEQKLKTALDESRLLILGAQVLFAFQFQAVFQELFQSIPWRGKLGQCGGLLLLLVAVGLLITPSLLHQVAYRGESRRGMLEAATYLAGISLLPLTLGLGASIFTIFDHLFGAAAGYITGSAFTVLSLCMLYGLGLALRSGHARMPQERETPLKAKIDQLLTEARVIIPGGQALLGFQLVATLTRPFSQLPDSAKYIHAFAICAVLSAVTLLMTPAALHRIAFHGEDNETFFGIGSALVIAAACPLALGISADVYVVFFEVSRSGWIGRLAAVVSLAVLGGLWFAYPVWHRATRGPRTS